VFDFLAELTQHIPDKGEHLVRYYGWYSYRQRGMRAKQGADDEIKIDRSQARGDHTSQSGSKTPHLNVWAALIQRVCETDPLTCSRCGSKMKIISFIETRQRDVIEKILRHCGLWEGPLRTLANPRAPPKRGTRPDGDEPRELQLWSSIPNSASIPGVSRSCRIEAASNFFKGAGPPRRKYAPSRRGKTSGSNGSESPPERRNPVTNAKIHAQGPSKLSVTVWNGTVLSNRPNRCCP
jgi:hypothetical protein